jgi:hypothetical protein
MNSIYPADLLPFNGVVYKLVPTNDYIVIDYFELLSGNVYYQKMKRMYETIDILGMKVTCVPMSSYNTPLFLKDSVVEKWNCISTGQMIDGHKNIEYNLEYKNPIGIITIANDGITKEDSWFLIFTFYIKLGAQNEKNIAKFTKEFMKEKMKVEILDSSNRNIYYGRGTSKKLRNGRVTVIETRKTVLPFLEYNSTKIEVMSPDVSMIIDNNQRSNKENCNNGNNKKESKKKNKEKPDSRNKIRRKATTIINDKLNKTSLEKSSSTGDDIESEGEQLNKLNKIEKVELERIMSDTDTEN